MMGKKYSSYRQKTERASLYSRFEDLGEEMQQTLMFFHQKEKLGRPLKMKIPNAFRLLFKYLFHTPQSTHLHQMFIQLINTYLH